ncbi:MAG: carboxypeptidase regulatory-like domain-containing protein, partial [Chloroflexi bacterium]|nr:carboxypeptidase regulatory-like domain-containing protein [Chloroflexota bacterium]
SSPIDAPDPLGQYLSHPHAMTVPYDVEALWVPDDRDSVWSDLAPNARATYPAYGTIPGVNDNFHGNAGAPIGASAFFAFNDFNADYWFVTGVPVPAGRGGTGTIAAEVVVPPALNSGVWGMQVPINARVGQTILLRCLDAAYNSLAITFPVDIIIIAWDGRALGVPPYGSYNHAYRVPAGTPINISTARRFDALIRATRPINSFATVQFIDTRGQVPGLPETVLVTARVPINITAVPFMLTGTLTNQFGQPLTGVTVNLTGAVTTTTVTDARGEYVFVGLPNGNYTVTPIIAGTSAPGSRNVTIGGGNVNSQDFVGSFRLHVPTIYR